MSRKRSEEKKKREEGKEREMGKPEKNVNGHQPGKKEGVTPSLTGGRKKQTKLQRIWDWSGGGLSESGGKSHLGRPSEKILSKWSKEGKECFWAVYKPLGRLLGLYGRGEDEKLYRY